MDNNFTELIRQWLETPADKRDYTVGNLYLLKLSGNQIMYRNLSLNPAAKAEFIEYQLRKYFNFRVQALTHEQVTQMAEQVEIIIEENIPLAAEADKGQRGKRDDHDLLPDNIKALFVENISLLQRMRELHLKLRTLSAENSSCPDSERYPFLKEMIDIDKKLHKNWESYDHYVEPVPSANAVASPKASGSNKKSKK